MSNSPVLVSFPEYDGTRHPEDWLRDLQFVAGLHGITTEPELVNLALLKISRPIRSAGIDAFSDKEIMRVASLKISRQAKPGETGEITKLSQVLELLKADFSFSVFQATSLRKLQALRFTCLSDVHKFTTEVRQLTYDAGILELEQQKLYLAQTLVDVVPTDAFNERVAGAQTIQEVFITLQELLWEYKRVVRYGSVISLRHVDTGKLLASSPNKYTAGSKQFWTYATSRSATDGEWWVVEPSDKEKDNKETGSPVYYGDLIVLRNRATGQRLHSHGQYQSPKTSQQEVTCQTWNNWDDLWFVHHHGQAPAMGEERPWAISHDVVFIHRQTNIGLSSHKYMLDDDHQEVTCFGNGQMDNTKWRVDILQ